MKAFMVKEKVSANGQVVREIQRTIGDNWGRTKTVIRIDPVPAIKELRGTVRSMSVEETIMERDRRKEIRKRTERRNMQYKNSKV